MDASASTMRFDGYTPSSASFSDSSTSSSVTLTRTPSPQGSLDGSSPGSACYWSSPRGSLLQELYEHEPAVTTASPPHDAAAFTEQRQPQQEQGPHHHPQQAHNDWQRSHEFPIMRRNTFPYVRQDRDDIIPPVPTSIPPSTIHHPHYAHPAQGGFHHPGYQHRMMYADPPMSAPHHFSPSYYDDPESAVKLEDAPYSMPSSASYYPHHPIHPHHPHHPHVRGPPPPLGMLPTAVPYHHTGLPVQHTDDAASKETQYLRRRCFNCHTTEPPSWRRSTLNPGKIVCNKCGLYERTHLRPRPLRFDELRAGNKARKQAKAAAAAGGGGGVNGVQGQGQAPPASPKGKVKTSGAPGGLVRRSSVSSNSDWDDNASVYSNSTNSSAPPTSFSSPSLGTYPLPLSQRSSLSPPLPSSAPNGGANANGIRLPNNPLSDIASLSQTSLLSSSLPSSLSSSISISSASSDSSTHSSPSIPPHSPPRKALSYPLPSVGVVGGMGMSMGMGGIQGWGGHGLEMDMELIGGEEMLAGGHAVHDGMLGAIKEEMMVIGAAA